MSGDHAHGHDHGHGVAALRAGARHTKPLLISWALIVAFLIVQVVVGVVTGSLALLSDAGHMATDALGLGMALAAIQAASNARVHPQRTLASTGWRSSPRWPMRCCCSGWRATSYEAIGRLGDPPDIASTPVLIVGIVGLVVNIVAVLLLRAGSKESLNLQGAYLEVVSDMLGSVGVILAAIVWGVTGWAWVDPLIGAAIGVFILPRAWKLGREALRVLVQAAPGRIDLWRCSPSWPASPASSMSTTCTCGPSLRRWTSRQRT